MVVVLHGTFDVDAARQTVERITAAPARADITLDFARAGEVQPAALNALLSEVPPSWHRLRTRGLSQHQCVLLKYLGAPNHWWQANAA